MRWYLAGDQYEYVIGTDGYTIAQVYFTEIGDEEKAKFYAQLMADAPETAAERDALKELNAELLSALKGLRCIMSETHCTCNDCRASKAAAIAAIAAAEEGV